jgi:hypothetical protein
VAGAAVGIGGLAVVATPVMFTGWLAQSGFTGCFDGCSEPAPFFGMIMVGLTLCLLALPVVAGLVTARVLTVHQLAASGWRVALAAMALIGLGLCAWWFF